MDPYFRGATSPLREWIYQYFSPHRVVPTTRWRLEKNTMNEFGHLYDCGDSRDGTSYKDVTNSQEAEVLAAWELMKQILADKPVPEVKTESGAGKCCFRGLRRINS
jgi:hypothetical protein